MPETKHESCGLLIIRQNPTGATGAIFDFTEIPDADYARYLSAAHRLNESLEGHLLVYAQQAFDSLLSVASQIEKFIRTTPIYTINHSAAAWRTAIGCCVLTFCSALHLHQEQSISDAVRHYGKDSAEHLLIREAFSEAYDGHFSYRLLYSLRNVLVHYSLRSVGLNLSGKERSASGLIVSQYDLRVPLNRGEYLRASVKAVIRREVEALPEDPDVLLRCHEVMPVLGDITRKIARILSPTLHDDALALSELDARFGIVEGMRALTRVRYSRQMLPVHMPQHILKPELFDYSKRLLAEDKASLDCLAASALPEDNS